MGRLEVDFSRKYGQWMTLKAMADTLGVSISTIGRVRREMAA